MTRQPVVMFARLVVVAVAYYAAARLGLRYVSIGESISLVWPPAGIATAALILWGNRLWPGVLLGAFSANAMTDVPLGVAGAIAAGNTLAALVGAVVFRRATGEPPRLEELRHVRAYVLLAAPAAALTAALCGVASLHLGGEIGTAAILRALASWWIGDAVGALVAGPVLLAWGVRPHVTRADRRIFEAVLLCIGIVAVAQLALAPFVSSPVPEIHWEYLLFPFVIWAALRFGPRGASLTTLTVAAVGIWITVRGDGPFIAASDTGTLVAVASYIGIVAVTGLTLAAAVSWERNQATSALRRTEERLRLALDAARLGIWYWSVDTNTLTWDANLRRIYGLDEDVDIASYEDFIERVHPDDRVRVGGAVAQALENGRELDYEFRIVQPNGAVRWIADQGRVVRNGSGAVSGMTGVCHDVTERRVADERLQAAHRMDSVGRLAGGVAHEANNQMSVVLGAAHFLLRRPDLDETARSDLRHISAAAERTAAVTAQLLAFSRRQLLKPVSIDLTDAVRQWEGILRRVMGEDCTVVLHVAEGLEPVRADLGQLQQVLLNLALNARDAMPRGGTITIETFAAELGEPDARRHPATEIRHGRYVGLAVSDTGSGMDQATLGQAFEPFFTTKAIGHGTGLGLATVYGIIKQSGGYVWAYSEPGMGSVFKVYLPVESAAANSPERPAPPRARGSGEMVLVIEDDAMVRTMTRRALEEAGYGVAEAEDGAAGLRMLRASPVPVVAVLSDLVMPGMSGPELALEVAALRPGTPVLFTSGYTDAEIGRRGLVAAGTPFLQKPSSPDAIVAFVARHAARPAPMAH
ncbi:MAG TPA: MASE1 domain-containing protein [Gemmatimonadales bacterium]|nr:MASE1 domain-containing protein [Gemmatimonadales bacterium]